jgi:hypothetical protein
VSSGVSQGSHLRPLCFIWFVNRISEIFDYARVLFYADDMMKLFLPVSGFHQECLKIQSDLNKLSEWCDRNSLLLNVGKCKTNNICHTTSSCGILIHAGRDRARSGDELHKRSRSHYGRENEFSEHVDVMVAKAFALLGFIKRLSLEFRDPYTLKPLYTSVVRPKLKYASCVSNPFYDVRLERVQMRFIRYALRSLGWTDMHDLPPYEDRCALLHYEKAIDYLCGVYIRCYEWEM